MVTTGQVVVVQLLPSDAAMGLHEAAGVGPVVAVPQVVTMYGDTDSEPEALHDATCVGPVVTTGQVVTV